MQFAQPASQILAHLGIECTEWFVEQQHLRFDGECTRQAGALFRRHLAQADVWDANHARIGGAGEPDLASFFEAAEAQYAHCAHRAVRFDPRAPGGALEAELLRRGWQCELFVLMALEGPPRGMPGDARVADVETDADWETFARLKQAAAGKENVVPFILECARCYCTLYEIRATLESEFGAYREPVFF